MKKFVLPSAAALVLAACGGGDASTGDADTDGDGSLSMSEAGRAVDRAGAVRPKAGKYEATIRMSGMEMPGMPAEMAGGEGFTTSTQYCLTQEEVDSGWEGMMKEGQEGDCNYERFDIDDGEMDAIMVCKSPDGDMRMAFSGTVGETASDLTATMTGGINGGEEGTMQFTAKHRRIGDC
ncbi:MAG: DUF3617 domain-containing protein [Erythrobacter sp.]|nr:DUF3617 domain-containing protein [Erythrobacter sp.]